MTAEELYEVWREGTGSPRWHTIVNGPGSPAGLDPTAGFAARWERVAAVVNDALATERTAAANLAAKVSAWWVLPFEPTQPYLEAARLISAAIQRADIVVVP